MELQSNSQVSSLTNPFGIYVHIPFCVHKCSYCDFYSFTGYDDGAFQDYAARLYQEVSEAAQWMKTLRGGLPAVTSIFLGGGTPSLLPLPLLEKTFKQLQSEFSFADDIEITMEANPETITAELVKGVKDRTPVNRISMGAQSFESRHLKSLERLGSADSIRAAAEHLRAGGFDNFSLDLIFGIPSQTESEILSDINFAANLKPRHLSFYSLTLKQAHPLHGALPSDDLSADLYESGVRELAKRGYEQYEISNFSRPKQESRHNLLYWSGDDYIGIGPSAASRIFVNGVFHHRKQFSEMGRYLKTKFDELPFEPTTWEQTRLEATFLELRKNKGVSLSAFRERYGFDLTAAPKFTLFLKEGLIQRADDSLVLTHRGRMLADIVTRDLSS